MSLHPFHAFHPSAPPALPLDEASLDAVLSRHTCAPRAIDKLSASPLTMKREGQPYRPLVAVMIADVPVVMTADTARRLAVHQDAKGRQGAAHDLIAAADLAEQLAALLQKASVH